MPLLLVLLLLPLIHGQSPKGGNPFLTPKVPAEQPLTFNRAVPAFTVKDTAGKVWTNRELAGKVTVVYRWRIECLPCQDTLPQLQRFFEANSGRADIQLLTFSERVPLVAVDFLKDSGYTFPVIVDRQLAAKVFPYDASAPGLWLVNREGVASQGMREWTPGRVLIEAERLARGK